MAREDATNPLLALKGCEESLSVVQSASGFFPKDYFAARGSAYVLQPPVDDRSVELLATAGTVRRRDEEIKLTERGMLNRVGVLLKARSLRPTKGERKAFSNGRSSRSSINDERSIFDFNQCDFGQGH